MAAVACCWAVAGAASAKAPAADPPATPPPAASQFAPVDISIGEPLQLPFERKAEAGVPTRPLASPPKAEPAVGSGWLGLTIDDSLIPGRLVVVEVAPQGPAAEAGIVPRDTVLAINGTPLRSADEWAAAVAAISAGMDVKMAVGRNDRIDELAVTAAPRPREPASPSWQAATPATASAPAQPPATAPAPVAPPASRPDVLPAPALSQAAPVPAPAVQSASVRGRTALGVRTVPVDPAVQARYQLPEQRGALVIGVVHDLPASKAGVPPGSVIVALDDQPVRDPNDLTRLVTSGPVGAPVPIQFVLPGGEARRAEVLLQSIDVPLERVLVGESP
jgi:S1-C subfamily serine protease